MTTQKKPKATPLRYFFYRGDLHKKIHINRPNDVITAWNYPKGKAEKYVYSDVRMNGERAWTTKQVCEFVNRSLRTINNLIYDGDIRTPQHSYGLDENRNTGGWFWSEKDIMDLHAHLSNVHYGRPRKDGRVTPKDMPSASELRAMIRQGTVLYVKSGDTFIPTWRADSI